MAETSTNVMTFKPATEIDLEQFEEWAIDMHHCATAKDGKGGYFIGNGDDPTKYPHIHIWNNGTIALSVGSSTNTKIGKAGEISIVDLNFACTRFDIPTEGPPKSPGIGAGTLCNAIRYVLMVATS